MSVIATISIPAEDFTMGAALAANPGIQVRLERVVPMEDAFIPYLWASNETIDELATALRNEADISAFDIVDNVNNEALVRIDWSEQADGFLDVLARTDAVILKGVGEADVWQFQLRFDDHSQLTAFYRQCAERGISLDLNTIHNSGPPRKLGVEVDLTDPQYETLRLALERGYFDVPRRINLVELADELNISDSAVSQRLRRGTATLLATIFTETDEPDRDE